MEKVKFLLERTCSMTSFVCELIIFEKEITDELLLHASCCRYSCAVFVVDSIILFKYSTPLDFLFAVDAVSVVE